MRLSNGTSDGHRRRQLGVDKEKITPETSFVNDLGADSLDTVELVMELEEEFDINIPDDAAEKIQTVGQAVQYIEAGIERQELASRRLSVASRSVSDDARMPDVDPLRSAFVVRAFVILSSLLPAPCFTHETTRRRHRDRRRHLAELQGRRPVAADPARRERRPRAARRSTPPATR